MANQQPLVVRTRAELDEALSPARRSASRIGLVPTMGALHAGHVALLRAALAGADTVVASIFVNPLQFGADEDLDRYPRGWDTDLATCAAEGVDVVFAPAVAEVYADEPARQITVDPGPLGAVLEGAIRPGHFRGVLTVVAKLFGMVQPKVAWFGEKDYQQLVLVRRLVADLALRVDVQGVPIVRDSAGLALSSRNAYLDADERRRGRAFCEALTRAVAESVHGAGAVCTQARRVLERGGVEVDYVAVTDVDLGDPPVRGPARLLLAGRVGSTRLIDNAALELGVPPGRTG